MNQSERASGRLRDLRSNVLARLQEHSPLTDLLGEIDSIDDGADAIKPSPMLDVQHRSGDAPDVALGIGVVTETTTRINEQTRKDHAVQADLQMRDRTLRQQGVAWHDSIRDEIGSVLDSHAVGWFALGETGGTPEPLWDEDINRYRSVQRFDIAHRG